MNNGSALLGIEGGGTRTVAILANAAGELLRRVDVGPANLRLTDDTQLVRLFSHIAAQITAPAAIGAGLAGCRDQRDRDRVRHALNQVWPNVPCRVTHDLETAWRAADSLEKPAGKKERVRVVVVSGTGSCCYGRRADGVEAKVGGWGHWLGDRGSGFDVALRSLRNAIAICDRSKRWGAFGAAVLRRLSLNSPEDLIGWINSASKSEIAALAKVALENGDRDAAPRQAIAEGAKALAKDAVTTSRRLVARNAAREFILAGGVFEHHPVYVESVTKRLHAQFKGCEVRLLVRSGAWGAVTLAADALAESGGAVTPSAEKMAEPKPSVVIPSSREMSPTERRNPRSEHLDQAPLDKAIAIVLEEEETVPRAILKHRLELARLIERTAAALKKGGRLFYVGAGTSGRLGVLDASECPPTFRTPSDMIQGIMAGGVTALHSAVEGAEDNIEAGAEAIRSRVVTPKDVVIGIAASGRTPFVWGALAEARSRSAYTVLLCFNPFIEIPAEQRPDLVLAIDLGPEVLTGSTRLKAGTATKLILNCLTTLVMTRLGKVAGNLMIDLNPSNTKLRDRAARIVAELCKTDHATAWAALEKSGWQVKQTIENFRSPAPRKSKRTKIGEQPGREHV